MRIATFMLLALAACQPSNPYPTGPAGSPVGVEWKLSELGGSPAGTGANDMPATLLFDAVSGRASGYAGCNQFSGSYTLSSNSITFGPLAMTRMACAKGDDLERRYTMALEQTTELKVTSTGLQLRKGSTLLARFTK